MPTSPGKHPDFDIYRYSAENRRSLNALQMSFYLTKSFDSEQIGNSVYRAALMRPSDEVAAQLNTNREIMCLFADYETFEVRTLQAFDRFYSFVDQDRVDQTFRILVSLDRDVRDHVSRYLSTNPEYPIIVPIYQNDLIANPPQSLLKEVRRNYIIRDLFSYHSPLKEENYFFGRANIISSAIDIARSGQHFGLFGLRKSGKTSSIYAIQRRARGSGTIPVTIDCQDPAVHGKRYHQMLAYIVTQIKDALGHKKTSTHLPDDVVGAAEGFSEQMSTLVGQTSGRILVIFDEIEQISPSTAASSHWRTGQDSVHFWQTLRSFCQTKSKDKVSICFVGTSPQLLEQPKLAGIDNPVYLFAAKNFLTGLTYEETAEMVTRLGGLMGLKFAPLVISDIYSALGGHPFFTRQLCSIIHQQASHYRPVTIDKSALAKAKVAFGSELRRYFSEILNNLRETYQAEFELLSNYCHTDDDALLEYALEAPELIDHLLGYGLIVREGDGVRVAMAEIKAVVCEMDPRTPAPLDRWAEINRRRNLLEQQIRRQLYYDLLSKSEEARRSLLQQSLTGARFSSLPSTELRNLFSMENSPLYLSDLAGIVGHSDTLLHLGTRKKEISAAIYQVNGYRNDAHANDLSEDQYRAAISVLEILESAFEGV